MTSNFIIGAGGGKSQPTAHTPYEAPDNIRSQSYARLIDLICEGEIEGLANGFRSIYIDETPLQNEDGSFNFEGVTVDTRNGTQGQTFMPGFDGVEAETSVSVKVFKAAPVVRTLTDLEADHCRVTVSVPALLAQNTTTGDVNGSLVQYKLEVSANGGAYQLANVGIRALQSFAATTPSDTVGFSFAVQWSPAYTTAYNPTTGTVQNQPASTTLTLQYKPTASGTWTTIKTVQVYADGNGNTFTPPSPGTTLNGSQIWRATMVVADTLVSGLAAGAYDVQVLTTNGSATVVNGKAYGQRSSTLTISGKTRSRYQRSHVLTLSDYGTGPWSIRLTRITNDSADASLQNDLYWDSFTAIKDTKLSYPNSALCGIKVNAKFFSSIPTRAYDVRMLKVKVPTNYDPITRVYTGSWDGTFKIAWTDNPAWCFYDLVTNSRYGVGDYISAAMIDKWSLYAIAQYCDELVWDGQGGQEPRYRCNVYIQSREEAYKVLQDMASIFRGMIYWGAGSIFVTQDRPGTPIYHFTQANVVDGMFTYTSTSQKQRHNVVLVQWNDPADMCRAKVEYIADEELISRWGYVAQTEVVAIGCTSRGQARRVGEWLLFTERYENETISFTVGLDGQIPRPGDLVNVSDAARAGTRVGGRLLAGNTTTTVNLDAPVTLSAGVTYTLSVILPTGALESRTVTTGAGTVSALTVGTAFSAAPAANAIWILAQPSLQPETFRVLSIQENDAGQSFTVTGLISYSGKYAAIEHGKQFQVPTTSAIPNPYNAPPEPANIVATDLVYVGTGGAILTKLQLSWTELANAYGIRGYVVRYRISSDNAWTELPETTSLDIEIQNVTDGAAYQIQVLSVNSIGNRTVSPTGITYTVVGKARPPSDVTTLDGVVEKLNGVVLSWPAVTDVDIDLYEVRAGGTTWETATAVRQVKATSVTAGMYPTGTTKFWVKAIDTSGNYSTNAASVSVQVLAPSAVTVAAQVIDNNVLLQWTAPLTSSIEVDRYEVRRGATFATATVIGNVKGLFSTVFETTGGTYTYWVVAIDLAGNYGTPGSTTALVSQPPDYVLIDNRNSTLSGTLSSAVSYQGVVTLPVNTTETYQDHFTSRSWAGPSAQVAAGFPIFIQPTAASGYYEEVIDYGATIPSSKITVAPNYTSINSPGVQVDISVSNTSATGPWTTYTNTQQAFATNFRWVKWRITVTATGNDDLLTLTGCNIKLDQKQKVDSGMVSCLSTDVGGTTVNFGVSFIDVTAITVTPAGTTAAYAIYDFVDAPNPTSFKVLLFNSSGARINGTVSWNVRGV